MINQLQMSEQLSEHANVESILLLREGIATWLQESQGSLIYFCLVSNKKGKSLPVC